MIILGINAYHGDASACVVRDGLLVAAPAEHVAQVAAAAGVVLAELRPAGSDQLEDLFLQLTADDAREQATR